MEPCELLAWDSEFFGVPTARVRGDALDAGRVATIDGWCNGRGVRWVYFLARGDDAQTIRLAEEAGFRLTDIRMTFARDVGAVEAIPPGVRPFAEPDLPALRAIARTAYTDSRFYADGRIPRAKCDELFDVWTVNSCRGRSDRVLVAEEAGQVAGYVTCDLDPAGRGAIGLIGVAEGLRGKGFGRRLVEGALAWAAERNLPALSVVTQGRNLAAQRLYQRCGFRTASVELYFHKWYDPPRPQGPA